MKKKKIFLTLGGIVVTFIFAIVSLLIFTNYGGNNCGEVCDCFCCHMFNSRGYEACGQFGFYLGIIVGLIIYLLSLQLIKRNFS